MMKKLIGFAMFAVAGIAMAQEAETNGWRLSLGASYRTFDDVDFESTTFTAPGSNFVNGNYTNGGNYTIQDDSQLQPGGWTFDAGLGQWTRTASFDRSVAPGDSEDADNGAGPIIELEREMWQPRENVGVSLLLGFGFFQSEADMNATTGSGITTTTLTGTLTSPVDPGAAVPATPYTVAGGAGFPLSAPLDLGDVAMTTATLRLDSELDLYVLSFGAKARCRFDRLSVTLAAGPTLNLADFETESRQRVTFNDDGAEAYSSRRSDDTQDVIVGAFVGVGADYRFSERWALGVGYRYDEVFSEIDTDWAEMDLSGHSVEAKLSWSF